MYFPKGYVWYDFFTGKRVSDGEEERFVAAPYEHIPLFVRSGSIIPVGRKLEYTGEKPQDNIHLFIYMGADGEFSLYEDEGTNYGYEAGRYARIPIRYDEATRTVTIGERQGEFPGMLRERTFTIVPVGKGHVQPYDPEAKGMEVRYDGTKLTITI